MGCQTKIASLIDDMDGYYILYVKEYKKELYNNIINYFTFSECKSISDNNDSGHGRIEKCTYKIISYLSHIERKGRWIKIKTIIKI